MNNIIMNYLRSLIGLQQLCEVKMDGTFCQNRAIFGIALYGGLFMVVCSDHYAKAKENLEERVKL